MARWGLHSRWSRLPLHAFFGVVIMMATVPMVDYFAILPAEWGIDAMKDRGMAGGLAWSYGERPSVLLLMFILVRWQRDETRSAAKADALAATSVNDELEAYNAYLQRLPTAPKGGDKQGIASRLPPTSTTERGNDVSSLPF